ncbi:sugar ABC transporter permease [Pseudolysinimonas yzui]|uniref:Cyclodextrin transporter permease n=1 Tax=Pseudolysinimonas yzui TaxID=2708254 RepID=A0A8J3DTZ4_9MICO|nr:sugar ABC transporter permease [Pseudolysinimonas yzui]GHF05290.1 cyclodextrin transporter permease [Pseudolysinimonas yzui]
MTATTVHEVRRNSPAAQRRRRNDRWMRLVVVVLIALAIIATLVPIYFVVIAAVNPTGSLTTSNLLPRTFTLDNFAQLFINPNVPFGLWFLNSLKISLIVTAIVTLVVFMSAYAFSRMRFRGREGVLMTIVLLQVFPNILAMVAIFLLVSQMGSLTPALGLNSHLTIIFIYVGGALGGNIWLLKGYMDSVPREIDESATIDGASHWIIFSRLIFPLVRPMLAVVAVLTFSGAYSEILVMQVLVRDREAFTLPLGLYTMSQSEFLTDFGVFSAGAFVAALPPLILFYISQKWLISGLTQGAVKS